MAEGVLLILMGKSTRLQDSFLGLEKQYRFRARWHVTTETGDREGQIQKQHEAYPVSENDLRLVMQGFVGEYEQIPPRYAALKYHGKPYYHWARQGIAIPRESRPVQIHRFELLSHDANEWEARVVCSRGTYVRTLAEDVAARLGTGSHLVELVRERVGPFAREQGITQSMVESFSLEDLQRHVQDPLRYHAGIV